MALIELGVVKFSIFLILVLSKPGVFARFWGPMLNELGVVESSVFLRLAFAKANVVVESPWFWKPEFTELVSVESPGF